MIQRRQEQDTINIEGVLQGPSPFSENISEIIETHDICERNAAEAARYLNTKYDLEITSASVRNYWKRVGLKPMQHGGDRKGDFLKNKVYNS